jgi:hypothetical protein
MASDRVSCVEETSCHLKPRLDVTAKLSPRILKHPIMKLYGAVMVELKVLFTSVLDLHVGLSSTPSDSPPRRAPPVC